MNAYTGTVDGTMKLYVHSREAGTGALFLVEIVIALASATLEVCCCAAGAAPKQAKTLVRCHVL